MRGVSLIKNELKGIAPTKMECLAKEIRECIESIRNYIQIDRQETLLMAVADISNYCNPSPEGDILFYEQDNLPSRPVEYLQSLIASTNNTICLHVTDEDVERLAHQYLHDQEMLFEKATQYLMYRDLALEDDNETSCLVFEAQMMHMVRGDRYRFLQLDYIRPLVFIHDSEFQKLFGISANAVIDGFERLEKTLSNGRLEGLAVLRRLFEKAGSADEADFSEIPGKDLQAAEEAFIEAFSVQHFNVERITNWSKAFMDALSFAPGEACFFEEGEMQYWPIVTLPIVDRPFIKLNGEIYCFDYYSLTDNFYRAVQKAILRLDPGYSEQWQQKQKEASESMVESVFKEMLPGCISYADNCYGSKKHRNENDLLVIYRDALLVVEVKAGRFTDAPPVSDFDSHIKRYKELIQKSNSQCAHMRDYIKDSGAELVLYDQRMQPKATINISNVNSIFCLSVTMENINTYAARAEKLGFLNLKEDVSCIAIDDLMTYREYFDNPLEFLHFLKQREIASLNERIALNDELDHLGMYIAHNCYSLEVDNIPKAEVLYMTGYREELDGYFERVDTPLPQLEKPRQNMPKRFREIIDALFKSNNSEAVSISSYLLDFSSDARQQLSDGIDMTLKRQASTGRQCVLSFSGKEDSIRMTYFVFQDELRDAQTDQEMFDYAASILLANGETDQMLMSFRFDVNYVLQSVGARSIGIDQIPPSRIDELKSRGEQMGDFRVAKYKSEHGKIGRNQSCPCGSGRKYKKCHGQSD